jgi:DNA-binding response OmpR family regulator
VSSPTSGADVRIALPDLSALTVLVVEDDTDSRHLLYEVLQSCGATVLVAEDGRTGQRHVGTVKLDLIVTDLALPGLDGVEFLRWLREQPRNRGGNVPVVAVTAYHERYPPTNVAGWAAYFRKPLDPHDLVRTIAAILRRPGPEPKIGGST